MRPPRVIIGWRYVAVVVLGALLATPLLGEWHRHGLPRPWLITLVILTGAVLSLTGMWLEVRHREAQR